MKLQRDDQSSIGQLRNSSIGQLRNCNEMFRQALDRCGIATRFFINHWTVAKLQRYAQSSIGQLRNCNEMFHQRLEATHHHYHHYSNMHMSSLRAIIITDHETIVNGNIHNGAGLRKVSTFLNFTPVFWHSDTLPLCVSFSAPLLLLHFC